MGGGIRPGRREAPYFDCPVIARGCKVFIGGIESDSFDMALMPYQCLQFFECVT